MSEDTTKPVDSLTEKIHQKADAELKRRIEDAFESVSGPLLKQFSRKAKHVLPKLSGFKFEKEVWPWAMVDAAKNALFEGCKDANRDVAVCEFMARFEKLSEEFAEYRNVYEEGSES